jgi:hypothetical protein
VIDRTDRLIPLTSMEAENEDDDEDEDDWGRNQEDRLPSPLICEICEICGFKFGF